MLISEAHPEKRLSVASNGQTTKSAAEARVIKELKSGSIPTNRNLRFERFTEGWWECDRCEYIKCRLTLNHNFSKDYENACRSYLYNHILPYFQKMKKFIITSEEVESWLMELTDEIHLLPTTVNHCLKTLRIMLDRALKRGFSPQIPP